MDVQFAKFGKLPIFRFEVGKWFRAQLDLLGNMGIFRVGILAGWVAWQADETVSVAAWVLAVG